MKETMPDFEAKPQTNLNFPCSPTSGTAVRASAFVLAALALLLAGGPAAAQDEAASASPEAAKAAADQAEVAAQAQAAKAEADREQAAKLEAQQAAAKAEAARIDAEKAAAASAVEWKAQSKGGFLMTSGNSQTTNGTFGLNASRKEGNNKLTLEGLYAYGKSSNLVATTQPSPVDATATVITGYHREKVVSTNTWAAKARYDRFLSENNTVYVSGQGAGDKVAGKKFFGGGQAGYSRQLLKDAMNLVVAELGYDYSYLVFESPDPSISVHSARIFVGETLSLTKQTGLTAGVEALFNLNKEGKAKNASNGDSGVDPFKDTRINAKLGISTNLYKSLSLGLGFTYKYTQNPASRPVPSDMTYLDPTYASYKFADKTDTITEATLVYTFF
jgi:hypothetical protein